jgi:hypothetical protein
MGSVQVEGGNFGAAGFVSLVRPEPPLHSCPKHARLSGRANGARAISASALVCRIADLRHDAVRQSALWTADGQSTLGSRFIRSQRVQLNGPDQSTTNSERLATSQFLFRPRRPIPNLPFTICSRFLTSMTVMPSGSTSMIEKRRRLRLDGSVSRSARSSVLFPWQDFA